VRRICEHCREPLEVPGAKLVDSGVAEGDVAAFQTFHGRGCDRCSGSGYKGRVGLFEVLEMSDGIRELVVTNAPANELKRQAQKEGMVTLRQSGLEKVHEGMTTIEEVVRETM
jgi:type IV pilus assembly protein PilB